MFEKKVDFVVKVPLSDAKNRLNSRVNLPMFRALDGFISFSGSENNGVYNLVHKSSKASRKIKIIMEEVNVGTKVKLSVRPTIIGQVGVVLGAALLAFIGVAIMPKSPLGGATIVVIGLAPLILKKYTLDKDLDFFKSKLQGVFQEKSNK